MSNQPMFEVQLVSVPSLRKENLFRVTVTNIGRQCSRVAFYFIEDDTLFEGDDLPLIFMSGAALDLTFTLSADRAGREIACVISYTDWFGEDREQRFTIRVSKTKSDGLIAFIGAPPVLAFPDELSAPSPIATT